TLRHENSRSPEIFGAIGVNPFVLIWQHGGEMFNHSGTRCMLDSQAVANAMTFYHQLIHQSQTEPVQAQSGMDEQPFRVELFTNGRLGMLWASRKIMTVLRKTIFLQQRRKEAWLKEHPDKDFPGPEPLRIGACLIPRFKDGQRFVNFSVDSIGINAGSKHKTAGKEFISFLSSQTYASSLRQNPVGVSGNKTFCSQEFINNPLFPDEHEINHIALKSARFARNDTPCYFASTPYIMRSFQETRFKIANSPNITPDHIKMEMKQLSNKINTRIQHSIQREKHLKKLYHALTGERSSPRG
ncbi:MAG: extracellular solute-binding protein, partial [Victivallales bacterium]|nr:extracellular solute-binding protein [Victivallales bacterium]